MRLYYITLYDNTKYTTYSIIYDDVARTTSVSGHGCCSIACYSTTGGIFGLCRCSRVWCLRPSFLRVSDCLRLRGSKVLGFKVWGILELAQLPFRSQLKLSSPCLVGKPCQEACPKSVRKLGIWGADGPSSGVQEASFSQP